MVGLINVRPTLHLHVFFVFVMAYSYSVAHSSSFFERRSDWRRRRTFFAYNHGSYTVAKKRANLFLLSSSFWGAHHKIAREDFIAQNRLLLASCSMNDYNISWFSSFLKGPPICYNQKVLLTVFFVLFSELDLKDTDRPNESRNFTGYHYEYGWWCCVANSDILPPKKWRTWNSQLVVLAAMTRGGTCKSIFSTKQSWAELS